MLACVAPWPLLCVHAPILRFSPWYVSLSTIFSRKWSACSSFLSFPSFFFTIIFLLRSICFVLPAWVSFLHTNVGVKQVHPSNSFALHSFCTIPCLYIQIVHGPMHTTVSMQIWYVRWCGRGSCYDSKLLSRDILSTSRSNNKMKLIVGRFARTKVVISYKTETTKLVCKCSVRMPGCTIGQQLSNHTEHTQLSCMITLLLVCACFPLKLCVQRLIASEATMLHQKPPCCM